MKQLSYLSADIFIKRTAKKGRGVFARTSIPARTMIERSPVVVMTGEERKLLDQTLLHDYIFEWGDNRELCCMSLGYVALYNHAAPSNCEYEMDFTRQLITVKTVRDIREGEELFINYNGDWDNMATVWFDVK